MDIWESNIMCAARGTTLPTSRVEAHALAL
jgi:hypothetical protein